MICNGVLMSYKNVHEVSANKYISGSVDIPSLTHSVWKQHQGFITDGFNLTAEKRETSAL
jgi:hypothetical protein